MKAPVIPALILFLLSSVTSKSQKLDWVHPVIKHTSHWDFNSSMSVDGSDNIYLAGSLDDTMYFRTGHLDPLPGGENGMYLAKYDSNCNLLWHKTLKTMQLPSKFVFDQIHCINDLQGNIFISAETDSIEYEGGTDQKSGILIKSDSTGNVLWYRIIGNGGNIATDRHGDVYITGQFYDSAFVTNDYQFKLDGGPWSYLIKYNSDGNVAGGRIYAYSFYTRDIKVGKDNQVYVLGNIYRDSAYIDSYKFPDSTGNGNNILIAFNDTGGIKWFKQVKGTLGYISSLSTDNFGNLYITGEVKGPGSIDGIKIGDNYDDGYFLIAKINQSGKVSWARSSTWLCNDPKKCHKADVTG